jgi:RNA polymerase sigma-70 factor (ECF subfamily)
MLVKYSKLQEQGLIKRMQKGDEEAFSLLFYAYKDKLYTFLFKITRSEEQAEDLVQEVFIRIWNAKETLDKVENFNAFIYRIAQNLAIDQLRKFSVETLALAQHNQGHENSTEDPYNNLFYNELKTKIEEAVNLLPPQQQKVYLMYKEQGFKQEEIAEKLKLSVSTIRNHMMQALTNLQKKLSHSYPDYFLFIIILLSR